MAQGPARPSDPPPLYHHFIYPPRGSRGNTGPMGPAGPPGAQGNQGTPGTDGADGTDGDPGAQGAIGPMGAQGVPGNDGAMGPPGLDGADGVDGAPGDTGPQGPTGATGAAGADGAPGVMGPAGFDGEDGTDGEPGPPGATGATGATGAAGADGAAGAMGPPGLDGTDGIDGLDGVPGATGATGATGAAGADGAAGTMGPPGFDGEPGADGADGVPGATGPAGAAGAAGATGATGSTGPPGFDGADGLDGSDGMPGVAGPTGATGATGAAGPSGPPGMDGTSDGETAGDMLGFPFGGGAHHALTGWDNYDDHLQYLRLAGRSGGQTARGGTAVADNLSLDPSSAANYNGSILLGANAGIDYSGPFIEIFPNNVTLANLLGLSAISWTDDVTVVGSSGARDIRGLIVDPVVRGGVALVGNLTAFRTAFTYINTTATNAAIGNFIGTEINPAFFGTSTGNVTLTHCYGVNYTPSFDGSGGSALIVGDAIGFNFDNPAVIGATIGDVVGLNVADLTSANTLAAAVRSFMNVSAFTRWHLYLNGTAPSLFGGPLYGGLVNTGNLDLFSYTPAWSAAATGRIRLHEPVTFPDAWTLTASTPTYLIESAATYTLPAGQNSLTGFFFHPTLTYAAAQAVSFSPAFYASPTFQPTVAATTDILSIFMGFYSTPAYTPTAAGCVTPYLAGYIAHPTSKPTVASTITKLASFASYPSIFSSGFLNANVTIGNLIHFECGDPQTAGGNPPCTEQIGLLIPTFSFGTTRSSILSTSTANVMRHAGSTRIGDTTVPTDKLEVAAGNATVLDGVLIAARTPDMDVLIRTDQYSFVSQELVLAGTTGLTIEGNGRLNIEGAF